MRFNGMLSWRSVAAESSSAAIFCAACRPRPWPPERSPGATWSAWRPTSCAARAKACILLWMQGGPSQFETFSPKPGHPNGGETKAICTAVPGMEMSENFPLVAKQAERLAIIRSMTSKEGSHPRATYLLHTGYLPTASVKYPAFGSIAAKELEQANFDLPSFVRIGNVQNGSSGGLLGSHFDPFVMPVAGKIPANSKPATGDARFDRRLDLLSRLESDYAATAPTEVADHQKLYGQRSE